LSWLTPKLGAIGVTRIANVTGLDYVGIPVVVSCRPAARSLSVQQGKGLVLDAAKVSAIMESVESFSAQRPLDRRWGSVASLPIGTFSVPPHLLRRELPKDVSIPWVEGLDLLQQQVTLVPEELVTTDFSWPRPEGYGWFLASSNGLAAGNTYAEALLHAVCELVERDARALWRQMQPARRAERRIDPETIEDVSVTELMRRYRTARMTVHVWDVTSDIDVPCFFCVIDDSDGRPPYLGRFGGAGCHTSAGVALCRALTEAAQSRLTFIVGTREDVVPERYAFATWGPNVASLVALGLESSPAPIAAIDTKSFDGETVDEDLEAVLTRLQRADIDSCIVVDLTDPEVGIPCVRAIIPQLEGFDENPAYRPGPRVDRRLRV
jgi:ribosomal protein S12 methylthiotransferase accessory factor